MPFSELDETPKMGRSVIWGLMHQVIGLIYLSLGNVDFSKSITTGHLLDLPVKCDSVIMRTIEMFEKESKEAGKVGFSFKC